MEYISSSSSNSMILGPLHSQNDHIMYPTPPYDAPCSTQLQSPADPTANHIMPQPLPPPTQHHDYDDDCDLDHLLLQIPPSFLDPQENNNHHDHDHDYNNQGAYNNNIHSKQGRKTSLSIPCDDHDHDHDGDQKEKKKRQRIQHREIERQRRLEMSSLHATLRSLLPIEYVKGKRSMSEHFNETVKYIKHLQQRIQVLTNQRDALKSQSSNNKSNGHDCNGDGDGDFEVKVHHCNNGSVEVIVSTSDCEVLPLSRVLQCLIKQGLEVLSSISTNTNSRLVYSIQAQVGDGRSTTIDAVELKQMLAETP